MKRIISAGFIIFRRDHKRGIVFLLLYHGRSHWSFPKGWLEPGEQAVTASFREVAEETGLRQSDLRLIPGFKTTDRFFVHGVAARPRDQRELHRSGEKRETAFKTVIYRLAETRKHEIRVSSEHEGYGWFTCNEALRVAKYEDIRKVIQQAHEFIPGATTWVHRRPARHHATSASASRRR